MQANVVKKIGLFWLLVLQVQGQWISFGLNNAGRDPRHTGCKIYDEHMCVSVPEGTSHYKASRIQSWAPP